MKERTIRAIDDAQKRIMLRRYLVSCASAINPERTMAELDASAEDIHTAAQRLFLATRW